MRRAAAVLGVRAQAIPAWLALNVALTDMANAGRGPICAQRPDQWSEDATPAARADAVEACGYCPARNACAAFADANQEKTGVWGGNDRTTRTRRKEAA